MTYTRATAETRREDVHIHTGRPCWRGRGPQYRGGERSWSLPLHSAWVSLEGLVGFLVDDLEAVPLRDDWRAIVDDADPPSRGIVGPS